MERRTVSFGSVPPGSGSRGGMAGVQPTTWPSPRSTVDDWLGRQVAADGGLVEGVIAGERDRPHRLPSEQRRT
jgi:hypothetical protein